MVCPGQLELADRDIPLQPLLVVRLAMPIHTVIQSL